MNVIEKIAQAKEILDNNKVNLYYCSSLSQIYFNDFIGDLEAQDKLLMLSGRNGVDYMIFANLYDLYFDDEKVEGLCESGLIDLYQDFVCYDYEGLSIEELKEELKGSITISEYYSKMYDNLHWRDLECDYILSGYGQGDAVKVLNLLGDDDDAYIPQKDSLHNLLFDNVVDGEILFDGAEMYFREYMTNDYEYDKDDFLGNFKKLYKGDDKEELLQFLKIELPAQLEYKYF